VSSAHRKTLPVSSGTQSMGEQLKNPPRRRDSAQVSGVRAETSGRATAVLRLRVKCEPTVFY